MYAIDILARLIAQLFLTNEFVISLCKVQYMLIGKQFAQIIELSIYLQYTLRYLLQQSNKTYFTFRSQ